MNTKVSKLETVKKSVRFILTSIAIASSGILQSKINVLKDSRVLDVILLTATLLFFVEILMRIINELLENSLPLRKFLLHNEFIEGLWVDYSDQNFGIIKIDYSNNEFLVSGESYDKNLNFLGNWTSDTCYFDKGIFKYLHTSNYHENSQELGYSEYSFFNNNDNKYPNQFSGYFIDLTSKSSKIRVQGQRISDDKKKLLTTQKRKIEFLKRFKKKL